jgi:hypothetical protein
MPPLKLSTFGGMLPARETRLLPDNFAERTENVWLYSGALEGFKAPLEVRTTGATTKRVYRIPVSEASPETYSGSTWMEFADLDTDVIRSPVTEDIYDRYYWTSPTTGPYYNTRARIVSGSAPLILGIPAPNSFPAVSPNGGVSDIAVSRSYLYTWVSEYGEEGPPSAPSLTTGKQDDVWSITIVPPTSAQQLDRRLDKVRIYRTITSAAGIATYFFVAELPLSTTLYSDTLADSAIAGNDQLQSLAWTPPPTDLRGMTSMGNGMIAGFRRNEVWFCEPYRPHAWPAAYTITTEFPIVGLGAFGQSLLICTTGNPVVATGVSPASISVTRSPVVEPCVSRGSIIGTEDGVYYASPNGLVRAAMGRIENITRLMMTREDWQAKLDPRLLRAARLGFAYYGWEQRTSGASKGIVIDALDDRVAFNQLADAGPITNVMTDPWTGDALILKDSKVYVVNPPSNYPMQPYTWKSKLFTLAGSTNFSAMKATFTVPTGAPTLASPNNALNQNLTTNQWGIVKVYADGVHRATRELRSSGEVIRLPSGFKATEWQFEIQARIVLHQIEIAPTIWELRGV